MPPLVVLQPSSDSPPTPFSDADIAKRIDACPRLASLSSISNALKELSKTDQMIISQVGDVIRRDPSLTARLLRMVNSVFFDLTDKVNSIEDAVFYLGTRQIRELACATPVIEDLAHMESCKIKLPWKEIWRHSIGTGIMAREIMLKSKAIIDDDTDYIIGLLHNVGKLVLATTFPEEFAKVVAMQATSTLEVCAFERSIIGWDHARVGGYYLQRHRLAPEIVNGVLYHNDPESAGEYAKFAAAAQVADHIVRSQGIIGGFEQVPALDESQWGTLSGWGILFGEENDDHGIIKAGLSHSLRRLPTMINSMV